jgi:hypothetical protein
MTKSVARQVFVREWILLILSLVCTILLAAPDPSTLKIDARNAPFVKIDAIIKSPKAFDQKVVSFVGLLRMDGNYLVLYQNEHDALAHDFARSIYVEKGKEGVKSQHLTSVKWNLCCLMSNV